MNKNILLLLLIIFMLTVPQTILNLEAQKILIRKKEKLQNRKALTWVVLKKWNNIILVGVDKNSDPYIGDTNVNESLPILSIKKGELLIPKDFPEKISSKNGWSGSTISKTNPVKGIEIASLKNANDLCKTVLGKEWRMTEFHDGKSNGRFWAYHIGDFEIGERFWVFINDQPANPWDLSRSNLSKKLSILKKNRSKENKYFKDNKRNKIQNQLFVSVKDCYFPGVKDAIKKGADINYVLKDDKNRTPLMIAYGYRTQKHLLNAGADTEKRDSEGRTALYFRIKKADKFTLAALLKAKANVNHKDKYGQTPLYWTIKYDKTSFAKKLINFGAKVDIKDIKNISLLQYAIQNNRRKIVSLFIKNGLKGNKTELSIGLIEASKIGSVKIVKTLLSSGADKDFIDSNGKNALWYAENHKRKKVIQYLRK